MIDDKLQSLWNKSKQQEPKMDQAAINHILEKAVRCGWSRMRINVWAFLAMLIGSEVFNIMNLAASAPHPGWLAVHAALTGVGPCGLSGVALHWQP